MHCQNVEMSLTSEEVILVIKSINTINCSFYWLGCTCSSKPCKWYITNTFVIITPARMGFSGTKKHGRRCERHSHSTRHGSSAGSFVDLFLLCRCTYVLSYGNEKVKIQRLNFNATQRGVKATWWNNIWAQSGAYPPPPPPPRITPYDGRHANESPSRLLIGYM